MVLGVAELNAVIASSPFNRWLGQKVVRVGPDHIEIAVDWREEFIGGAASGHAHGGIFSALINAAGCYALAARLGRTVPTVDLRCDFLRPGTAGALCVVATIVSLQRAVASVDVRIFDHRQHLLACGRALYATARANAP